MGSIQAAERCGPRPRPAVRRRSGKGRGLTRHACSRARGSGRSRDSRPVGVAPRGSAGRALQLLNMPLYCCSCLDDAAEAAVKQTKHRCHDGSSSSTQETASSYSPGRGGGAAPPGSSGFRPVSPGGSPGPRGWPPAHTAGQQRGTSALQPDARPSHKKTSKQQQCPSTSGSSTQCHQQPHTRGRSFPSRPAAHTYRADMATWPSESLHYPSAHPLRPLLLLLLLLHPRLPRPRTLRRGMGCWPQMAAGRVPVPRAKAHRQAAPHASRCPRSSAGLRAAAG